MKKLFTFAFIFALAAVCPVIADTATTDTEDELNSLIAQLNEDTTEPAAEQNHTEATSAEAESSSESSSAHSAE